MLSKELKERLHIIVEPINKAEFESFFKEIESVFLNPRKDLTETGKLFYQRRTGFQTNLFLLRENYKLLNANPSLQNIQKQLGYIVLLKIHFADHYSYWEDWEEEFLKLENRVSHFGKPNNVDNDSIYTYKWAGLPNEIQEIYNDLYGSLICDETTQEEFEIIFRGVNANEIKKPVKWHDNNATEALYLVRALTDNQIISNKGSKHKRFALCIVKPDGSVFSGDLKSSYSKCHSQLDPAKKDIIDAIVLKYK